MKTLVIAVVLIVAGCAGSWEAERGPRVAVRVDQQQRCQDLDDRHQFASGVGKSAAVLASGATAGSAVVEDDRAKLGLVVGGAVLAAASGGSWIVADKASESWARECARE